MTVLAPAPINYCNCDLRQGNSFLLHSRHSLYRATTQLMRYIWWLQVVNIYSNEEMSQTWRKRMVWRTCVNGRRRSTTLPRPMKPFQMARAERKGDHDVFIGVKKLDLPRTDQIRILNIERSALKLWRESFQKPECSSLRNLRSTYRLFRVH